MPLNPRLSRPAERSNDVPHGFREWSEQVADMAATAGQARTAQRLLPGIDLAHPLARMALVAFIGYTFGRLMHRRKVHPPAPARPQHLPRATGPHLLRPERSGIHYR